MRLWSKGLGKLILPFEVDKAEKISEYDDGGERVILIQGRIIEKKVNWPYKIYLGIDDMIKFTALMAKNNLVIGYIKAHYGYKFITFVLSLMFKAFFLYLPAVVFEKFANFFGRNVLRFRKKELAKQESKAVGHQWSEDVGVNGIKSKKIESTEGGIEEDIQAKKQAQVGG